MCRLRYVCIVVPGTVMRVESVVVLVGHEGQSGHVMVGHDTEGQTGQGSCSGHSVEIMSG